MDITIKRLCVELRKEKYQVHHAVSKVVPKTEMYIKLTKKKQTTYLTEAGADLVRKYFEKKGKAEKPRNRDWMYKDLGVMQSRRGGGIPTQTISKGRQSF